MKKILMISYYFPPTIGGGIFRVMRFIKYLPQDGWIPIVLTPKESYVEGENREVGEKMAGVITKDVRVIRTLSFEILSTGRRRLREIEASTPNTKKNKLSKIEKLILNFFKKSISNLLLELLIPDEFIGWLPFAFINGKQAIKKEEVEVIYTTSPPDSVHLIGLLLKKTTNKFWIADFRDPWTQKIDFQNRNFIRRKIELFLEAAVVRNADKVVTTTPIITGYFANKYPECASKITTITNGFDPRDFSNTSIVKLTKKFTITHTGYLFGHRNAVPFLEATLSLIRQGFIPRDDIEVRFIGYVDNKTNEFVEKNRLRDVVKIINYLPHDEIIEYLRESTVLLLVTDPRGAIQIPGKLFEYLFAKRPIIALVPEGICADIVNKTKTGWVIDFEDSKNMEEIVREVYRDFKNNTLKTFPDYNEIEKYNVEKLTNKLAQCLHTKN